MNRRGPSISPRSSCSRSSRCDGSPFMPRIVVTPFASHRKSMSRRYCSPCFRCGTCACISASPGSAYRPCASMRIASAGISALPAFPTAANRPFETMIVCSSSTASRSGCTTVTPMNASSPADAAAMPPSASAQHRASKQQGCDIPRVSRPLPPGNSLASSGLLSFRRVIRCSIRPAVRRPAHIVHERAGS